uniref:C4-type zinc-finger of DNA polymerase delta domain-containing protein n=1 Tax=Romanomermis culicivorax TaxID=13658 RepID=A0A915J6T5_ROMCU
MSQYLRSAECLICRSKTLGSEQICKQCSANPQELILSLRTAAKQIERKFLAVDKLCQICSSSSSNRSKLLVGSCISLDCPIYSKRLLCKLVLNRLKTQRRLIRFSTYFNLFLTCSLLAFPFS